MDFIFIGRDGVTESNRRGDRDPIRAEQFSLLFPIFYTKENVLCVNKKDIFLFIHKCQKDARYPTMSNVDKSIMTSLSSDNLQ